MEKFVVESGGEIMQYGLFRNQSTYLWLSKKIIYNFALKLNRFNR